MWKDVTVVRKKLGRKCTQFGETHVIAFTAFLFQKYRNPMPMTKWQKIWQHDINVKRRIIFTNFMKVKPNVYLGLTLKISPLKMFDFQTYFKILFLHSLEICRFVCPWGTCWSAWDTWSGSLWQSHTAPVKMIKSDFFRQNWKSPLALWTSTVPAAYSEQTTHWKCSFTWNGEMWGFWNLDNDITYQLLP